MGVGGAASPVESGVSGAASSADVCMGEGLSPALRVGEAASTAQLEVSGAASPADVYTWVKVFFT